MIITPAAITGMSSRRYQAGEKLAGAEAAVSFITKEVEFSAYITLLVSSMKDSFIVCSPAERVSRNSL